jgi:hypothetical protein
MSSRIPDCKQDAECQPALKHASRPGQTEQFARIPPIIGKMSDKQDKLGSDQRYNNGIESHVQQPGAIHIMLLSLDINKPEPQGYSQSQHETVGMNSQRTEL